MRTPPLLATSTAALTLALAPALAGATASTGSPSTDSHRPDDSHRTAQHQPTPTIYAHRGASGYRPEHTLGAYQLAVAQGADYFEPDLVMTKDGVLVDRHEPEISETTDVATHPEFAARKTTKSLDGKPVTGWFVEDFTLKELRTLRAVERVPDLRPQNTKYDGKWVVPTFEETLRWRESLSRRYGRTIGIIPEIKHSTYLHSHGLNPEKEFVRLATKYKLNKRTAPIWVQSFEWTNLVELRTTYGFKGNEVFLADSTGGPYDLVAKGTPRSYDDMLTPRSLRQLRKTVNGVAPYKERVIPRVGDDLGEPTSLVKDAHRAGLTVTIWTLRAENNWLPKSLWIGSNPAKTGNAHQENLAYLKAGVDGIFCDQPDICVESRRLFWKQSGKRR